MKPENLKLLTDGAAALGFPLSAGMPGLFARYFDELIKWNARINLTAITDEREVVIKHFIDSLAFAKGFDTGLPLRLLDIGAGAGFPGIPLKIVFPSLDVVLLDSVAKKVSFMSHVCRTLGLSDITAIHGRAEELARKPEFAGSFDLVTLRAVTDTEAALNLAKPFLKKGGRVVMSRSTEEMRQIKDRMTDYSIVAREELVLPGSNLRRTILAIEGA
ncbi:MAG: 16S rRNA (guanine(527)-N(7))-methyltransferase RsmG [Nitrospirota bacterium]|nr:16S rRNA (guanine(527)-N(7))-methyltransferase RsmG [Nitrospirota bacterium]